MLENLSKNRTNFGEKYHEIIDLVRFLILVRHFESFDKLCFFQIFREK